MREIKISQETASRWYNGTDSELKELALQTYPELAVKELPKNWEDLGRISGYYVNARSEVVIDGGATNFKNRNFFATEEQVEASIAMAQLSQLMAVYNDGWVADWSDGISKDCLCRFGDKFTLEIRSYYGSFLTFKDRKTAELFLENFSSLIQTAKPLL